MTESSVRVSSSRFLNSPVLRDWVATSYLRRSGLDRTDYTDNLTLNRELRYLRDEAAIDRLTEAERQTNPVFDRWIADRHLSRITEDDLAACDPDTVGAIYLSFIRDYGFTLNIGFDLELKTTHDYFAQRQSETHDFEHIVCGARFSQAAENQPVWAVAANCFRHLSPPLASEMMARTILGANRWTTRSVLFYPDTFPRFIEAIRNGIKTGLASGPLYVARYEDVLNMTPEAARLHLGIREVTEHTGEPFDDRFGEPDPGGRRGVAQAEDMAKGIPYIKAGNRPVETTSSTLVSSSHYLNSDRLYRWVGTHFLRRNGSDMPPAADLIELEGALHELRDFENRERLFDGIPGLFSGCSSRDSGPNIDEGALRACPRGSLGAAVCDEINRNGPPQWVALDSSDPGARYPRQRRYAGQQRRFAVVERVACGAGLDSLGEVLVQWARLANDFKHLSPALASELNVGRILAAYRMIHRVTLHYPEVWTTMATAILRGIEIGEASDLMITMPYADVLELPLGQARAQLGLRMVDPVIDTREASALFDDVREPS